MSFFSICIFGLWLLSECACSVVFIILAITTEGPLFTQDPCGYSRGKCPLVSFARQSCLIWSPHSGCETCTFHFLGFLLLCSPQREHDSAPYSPCSRLRSLGLAERRCQLFTTHGAVAGFALGLSNRAFTPPEAQMSSLMLSAHFKF